MTPILLREIAAEHYAQVERRVFDNPWKSTAFGSDSDRLGLWLKGPDGPLGFVYGNLVLDEAELWRIAVVPDCRRQGLAGRLWDAFREACVDGGAARIFLEVRADNLPAIAFYEGKGFVLSGRRRNYYGSGVDGLSLVFTVDRS